MSILLVILIGIVLGCLIPPLLIFGVRGTIELFDALIRYWFDKII